MNLNLADIRAKIDALDTQLLRLLNERADLVYEVGVLKRKDGVAIYAPEREEQLLRALTAKNQGRLSSSAIRAIYREIMSASLSLEKDLTIAYLGPEGSWAHQAAREKFGASVLYAPGAEVEDVFSAVQQRVADYGVLPMEDPAARNQTLDLFVASDLKIRAEVVLQRVKDAARFLVIGHDGCPATGQDKTSIMFELPDKPGALVAALEPFQRMNVNVSKIESRPARRETEAELFFLDAMGHVEDEALGAALKLLGGQSSFLKVLGSYPLVEVLKGAVGLH